MPVVSNITNAQLAQKISDLVNSWRTFMGQLQTWLAGTVGGGPSGDGKYPLTDSLGNTYNIEAPAQLAADVTTIVGNATEQASNAAGSATAAAASATSATTQATNASASAATASTKATAAATAASLAQSYAAAAGTNSSNAAASASAASGDASASHADRLLADADVTAAAGSASAAAVSASAAAASAAAAATFNPALFAHLNGAAFTGGITGTTASFSSTIAAINFSGTHSGSSSGTNTGDQNLAPFARLAGATFTGVISASNLSGTNTGDQNLAPYALLAGAAFTGSISASNLSGTNTGDQNLAPYALLAGAAFAGAVNLPRAEFTGTGTGSQSWFSPAGNEVLYSIIGSDFWGPSIQARWDTSTVNRYMAFGFNTNAPGQTFVETFRIQDGITTFAGGGAAVGIGMATDSTFAVLGPNGCSMRIDYTGVAGDNYYDASRHNFRDTNASLMLQMTPTYATYSFNDAGFSAGSNGVTGIILNNASGSMQTAIEFQKLGFIMGRIRSDFVGNMNYTSGGSAEGGVHNFFVGGDSGVGGLRGVVNGNGMQTPRLANLAQSMNLTFGDTSVQQYGTAQLNGGNSNYIGLMLNDGAVGATFMSQGLGATGVYFQTAGRWSFYDDNSDFNIVKPAFDITRNRSYASIVGATATGSGTISFQSGGAPSGGEDGDIIFIY